MTTHIVIDLETLSLDPHAHILSIGAVALRGDGRILEVFHHVIDPEQVQQGRHIDPATVAWWMTKTEPAARAAIWGATAGVHDAPNVLAKFSAWVQSVNKDGDLYVWGNGPDCTWMESLYRWAGHSQPWEYWQNQSIRTLKLMAPACVEVGEFQGVRHHALDDAMHEARMLRKWLQQTECAPCEGTGMLQGSCTNRTCGDCDGAGK